MTQTGDDLEAWRSLLLAHAAALHAIERDVVAAADIPLTWYDVLLELKAAPGGRLRMQDLGRRVVVSRSRVSRIVDELERAGFVERTPDAADGRAILAGITDAGRAAQREAAPHYLDAIDRHFTRHLTSRERALVARALAKVVDAHADDS